MNTNTDPVWALIGEMTEYLDQQVDPELDVIAKWRDRLEDALASAPQPSFDRRFADMLIGILNDVQDELGFTDEDKLCANGSAEIVAAIRELKERALSQQPAPPSAPVGVEDGINVPAARALIEALAPGFKVIYRSAFRWLDQDGNVLPNHYEMFSAETLARDFGYDLVLDLGYAAILRDPSALSQQPAAPSGEAVAWVTRGSKRAHVRWFGAHEQSIPHGTKLYAAPQQPAAVGVTKRELFTIVAMHTLAAGGYAKWEHLAHDAVSLADATLAAIAAQQQGGRADGFAANRQEGE